MTKTQDKTSQRVKKFRDHITALEQSIQERDDKAKRLQALLERCRENITENKSTITNLQAENVQLKKDMVICSKIA